MSQIVKNDKRTINGWAIFDWANSAYALVISTAIFPVYFIEYTSPQVEILGFTTSNTALYSFSVAAAYVLIAILSPLLSGIADYSGRKKIFLKLFTVLGSLSCMCLYFFQGPEDMWIGTICFVLATLGFAGGIVFYNAYLPTIVTEDRYDQVSAKGFAYGYVGSVILLVIILVMIQKPAMFGISDPQYPARLGFLMVGIWWLGFAQITFKRLPDDSSTPLGPESFKKGFQEIWKVFKRLTGQPALKRFLLAFFCYSAGVQTIIYVATVFAKTELNFESSELILLVLILQLVAIGGAYLFAWVSKIYSNKLSLIIMLLIWITICLGSYFTQGKMMFYGLSAMVGLVMGGIQSLSRSTYSKMLEDKDNDVTSYFSFYDVLYKTAIVAGTFLFALVDSITGDMRNSILVLTVFFVAGMLILLSIKKEDMA